MSGGLVVDYFHQIPGAGNGNILWRGRFPMRAGLFPKDHPAAPSGGIAEDSQFGDTDLMVAFRGRGYWASCFPEGDGITMRVKKSQDADQVAKDIAEVFGWTVCVRRA